MNARTLLAVMVAGLALAGCGYKGQLTLPEKQGEVITRPGPAAGSQATPPKTPPEVATPEATPPEVTPRTGGSGG